MRLTQGNLGCGLLYAFLILFIGVLSGCNNSTDLPPEKPALVSIEIAPSTPEIAIGTSKKFTATGIYQDSSTRDITSSVNWDSSDTNIVTISNDGATQGSATALETGTVTISATHSETDIKAETTLTVTPAVLIELGITPTNPTIALGMTTQFTATGTFSDSTTQDMTASVDWLSDEDTIAPVGNDVTNKGLANGMTAGRATITATDSTSGISANTTLNVTASDLVSIEITPNNPSRALGTTVQFTATGTFSDSATHDITASVNWDSSDTAVATTSNNSGSKGLTQSVSQGSATITATDTASGISAAITLSVTAATLDSIEITPTNPTIGVGTKQPFTATGIYSDASTQDLTTSVTWSSSDTSIASISNVTGNKGLADGMAPGAATIAATDPASEISSDTTLTVTAATLTSIEITPAQPSIVLGTPQQFTATGTYSDSTTQDITASVTWSSSDTAVATISNDSASPGLSQSVGQGSVTITATDAASGTSADTTLTVTAVTLTSIEITPAKPSIVLGATQQFTATGTYSDSTTQDITASVTWSSSDTATATISNASGNEGLAEGMAPGSVTITATDPVSNISSDATLTISAATLTSIEISPFNPSIALGTTQQFTATGIYSDASTQDITASVAWSSSDTAVATIGNTSVNKGLVDGLAPGNATITATDLASNISSDTTLTVSAAMLTSISILPADPSIGLGAKQQFTATGTYSDSTTQDLTALVTWSSSDPGIATISNAAGSQGLAHSVAQGTATITATDPASALFAQTTLTITGPMLISIKITPANPSIAIGASQQFTATGTYSDASTQDLTSTVIWRSSNNMVATISNAAGSKGLAVGVRNGVATISAVDNATTVSAVATLTVLFNMPH